MGALVGPAVGALVAPGAVVGALVVDAAVGALVVVAAVGALVAGAVVGALVVGAAVGAVVAEGSAQTRTDFIDSTKGAGNAEGSHVVISGKTINEIKGCN